MKLLLISNSTQHGRGYLDHCAGAIQEFLGDRRRVWFLPFALHDWEGYTATVRKRLESLNLEVRGAHEDDVSSGLGWCEAVFAGGGNTFRLVDQVQRREILSPLSEKVRQGLPYLGSSAGTNLACPTIMTTNDMPIVSPASFQALNLVPFQINPHYLDPDPSSRHQGETREQRIREFHEVNRPSVLGLREGAWLQRNGNQLKLAGDNGARLFQRNQTPQELAPGSDLSWLL